MKRSLLAMLLIGQLGQAANADPNWANDASKEVKDRKIMRGTPHDSSLQGERPVKRDELAEILERLDQAQEREQEEFATKEDLNATQRGATSLREEIEAVDERVDNLEQKSDNIEQRDKAVTRPRI